MANDSLDFVQRGKVSIVRRQYADAVKICRLGLLAHPTLLEGRLVLGMALTALQRWDEVLAEMRVALEVDAQSPLAWLLKGEALVGKGDFQQAEGALSRAKELDPSNTKADQLLAEIQVQRAAGFEGIPAEPTDTKVYPAKAGDDARLHEAAAPLTSGSVADLPDASGEHPLADGYDDETTEVDPDPSDRVLILQGRPPKKAAAAGAAPKAAAPNPGSGGTRAGSAAAKNQKPRPLSGPSTNGPLQSVRVPVPQPIEVEDSSTETFVPARAASATGDETPATLDYADRARRASLAEEPSSPGAESKTPIELRRPYRPQQQLPSLADGNGQVRAPVVGAGTPEPSIELTGGDLIPSDDSDQFDLSDEEEEEETRQRDRQRQVDENAGTRPESPEPAGARRVRPLSPFTPEPSPRPNARPSWNSNEAPTSASESPTFNRGGGTHAPGVVRVPVARTAPSPRAHPPWHTRLRDALMGDRPSSSFAMLVTALVVVIAVGVVTGLIVREWRMRARVAKRHELARQKMQSGNYPGFQAAELLYRQILTERDDSLARALRARTLAQMAFEFGDPSESAERAVGGLGAKDASPEAQQARIYLALTKGELDQAGRLATALRRKSSDAYAAYLAGRSELLLERPEGAADALRSAADRDPRDPVILHALGLAEAAAHHEDRALDAYKRALEANANHIATIIDRAVLQARRGQPADRDAARGALEGVVSKLVGDSSPGQLGRAFLGIAELELARGDLEAARRMLASATAKHREGDPLLSEELAEALARAFELDAAEKEARRAVAGFSGLRLAPRLVLAEISLKRGRPAQALLTIEEAATSRPDALLVRSQANLLLGRRDEARKDAEQVARVLPDSPAGKLMLARIDVADGHPERAQRDLERMERGPKLAEVAEVLGEVFSPRAPERAKWWFTEALRRDPLQLDARLQLGRLLHASGKLDEARAELNTLLGLNPAYVPARREMAFLALDQGDAEAARDQFDTIADKESDFDTLVGAARAHLQLGDSTGAEERARNALKIAPPGSGKEEATALLARTLLALHRAEEAAPMLRQIAPAAQRGETAGLLMNAYLDLDQPDRAAEVPLFVPPRVRGTPEVIVARARLQVERGRDVAAESLAQDALTRLQRPTAPRWVKADALTILGRSQWEQGSFKQAVKSLKTATELDPKSARAAYYYAMVLEELHRIPEARTSLELAVKIDPKFSEALYYLGRMLADAGDPKAQASFQAYLAVAPKGIYADEARKFAAGQAPPKPSSSPPRKRRRGR